MNWKFVLLRVQLFFTLMNDSKDIILDAYLKKLIKIGIKKTVFIDYYWGEIEFNNGTIVKFWNSNKYYGWFYDGSLKGSNFCYKWYKSRPSKNTMAKLIIAISEISI